jgi:predicted ArsR family transcriptional regulator
MYNNCMDNNSRQEILAYLRLHPRATARQISLALQLTPADIRYHINNLLKEQRITIMPTTQINPGRGRPARVYSLTQQSAPEPHIHLLLSALTVLFNTEPAARAGNIQRLSGQLIPRESPPPARFISKIKHLIEQLNRLQYHARWEARPAGPCIIFQNCPYRDYLRRFPDLCELDRQMLQNSLRSPVILEHHAHPDQAQPPDCRFTVQLG